MKKLIILISFCFCLNSYSQNMKVLIPSDTTANITAKITTNINEADVIVYIAKNGFYNNQGLRWKLNKRIYKYTIRFVNEKPYDFVVYFTEYPEDVKYVSEFLKCGLKEYLK